MSRPKKIDIEKIMNKKQLNNTIRRLEEDYKVLQKLYFIRHLYYGKSVEEAAKNLGISISTAYIWLNRWNEQGIDGLRTKSRSGRPGSLSDEDKEKLDEIFFKTDLLTTQKAHKIIKDNFDLDFTLKHVRTLLHQLGYNHIEKYSFYTDYGFEKINVFRKH